MHFRKAMCVMLQFGHTAQPWRSLHMQSIGTAILQAASDNSGACLSSRTAVNLRHCSQYGRLAFE